MKNEIDELNEIIKMGIIKTDFPENESILACVWGIMKMQYMNLTWQEHRQQFLGGGIYAHYWYTLKINNQQIKRNYKQSIHLFLHYVNTH
jgi:hypothetical protein